MEGLVGGGSQRDNAVMKADEARELAESAARADGWNVSQYEPPEIGGDDNKWVIYYRGKVATVGNHFTVVVEPGKKVRVIPGR